METRHPARRQRRLDAGIGYQGNHAVIRYFCGMSRDTTLKARWETIVQKLSDRFSRGEDLDLERIIYLIGVQELGRVHGAFKKDEKVNLMHIAICRLLEPYGYYEFDHFDRDGWPHYNVKEQLPPLKAGEQSVLMKEAIVKYFLESKFIE